MKTMHLIVISSLFLASGCTIEPPGCNPGTKQCVDLEDGKSEMQSCDDDRNWIKEKTCPSQCNDDYTSCACRAGATVCEDGVLYRCADLSGKLDLEGTCPTKTCKNGSECGCPANQHFNGESCVADTVKSCGASGANCEKKEGYKTGKCKDGICIITECAENYHSVTQYECKKDSVSFCGSETIDCQGIEGWALAECINGKCVARGCIEGFSLNKENECRKDSDTDCGEQSENCLTIEGWEEGSCIWGTCFAKSCKAGWRINLKTQRCEPDEG